MGTKTGISWTDATWNPIRGCSRVSEGCRHCYAEHIAYRFSGPGQPYEGLVEEHLLDPLKWRRVLHPCSTCGLTKTCICPGRDVAGPIGPLLRSRRIFVNSMSDLFHENVTDEMRDKIFAVMALCPQHTFQVLTKRPERMLAYLTGHFRTHSPGPREMVFTYLRHLPGYDPEHPKWIRLGANAFRMLPLPNVWFGVSVEDRKNKERIDTLREAPAARRFLSLEPLLEDLGKIDLYGIDWVIVGGESGAERRPGQRTCRFCHRARILTARKRGPKKRPAAALVEACA